MKDLKRAKEGEKGPSQISLEDKLTLQKSVSMQLTVHFGLLQIKLGEERKRQWFDGRRNENTNIMQENNINGLDLLLLIILFLVNYRRIIWKEKYKKLFSYRYTRGD